MFRPYLFPALILLAQVSYAHPPVTPPASDFRLETGELGGAIRRLTP